MVKLTRQDLQERYADRKVPKITEPASRQSVQMHHGVFASLSVLAGIMMFVGVITFVNPVKNSDTVGDKKVLGAATSVHKEFSTPAVRYSLIEEKEESEYQKEINEELEKIIAESKKDETAIEVKDAEDVVPVVVMVKIREVDGGWVNYRNSSAGRVIGRVPSGAEYEFLLESDSWVEIKISQDITGWVSADLVDKI